MRLARLRDVVCIALFLAYAWAGVDTRLMYYGQGPVFSTAPGFFEGFLRQAGGFGEYLRLLFAQAWVSRAWGAVVLTAQATAAAAFLEVYFRKLGARPAPLVRFLPALVLLQPDLYYKPSPVTPSILLALALAAGFAVVARNMPRLALRIGTMVAMLGAAYWLGGMWAGGVFALAALALLIPRRARQTEPSRKAAGSKQKMPRRRLHGIPEWAQAVLVTALVVGVAAGSWFRNAPGRRVTAIYYHASCEDWPAVLDSARALKTADFNPLVQYEINLALHESHRLADEMFRYPQPGAMLLDFRVDSFLPYTLALTDMCLRLGRVNEAEEFAADLAVAPNPDPRLRRTLYRASVLKNQTGIARRLLTSLSFDPASAGWARRQLSALEDPASGTDSALGRLRARVNRTDDMVTVWQRAEGPVPDTARMLLDQLDADPANRMAFEFLMGSYLLTRDLPSAADLLPRIQAMSGPAYVNPDGTRRTPRLYQEAMAMLADATGRTVQVPGFGIQPETLQRLDAFKTIFHQYPSRERAQREAWAFRDTYFFYFAFGPGDYR